MSEPRPGLCERLLHPDLVRLYDYWAACRRGRRLPSRQDLHPAEFKFVLGNVLLIDVEREPLRFRFRLVGSLLVERMGGDLTGRPVDEVADPIYRDGLIAAYRQIVETRQPSAALYERVVEGRPYRYQVLRLPLGADGETVDMLMLCPLYLASLPAHASVAGPLLGSAGAPRLISEDWAS